MISWSLAATWLGVLAINWPVTSANVNKLLTKHRILQLLIHLLPQQLSSWTYEQHSHSSGNIVVNFATTNNLAVSQSKNYFVVQIFPRVNRGILHTGSLASSLTTTSANDYIHQCIVTSTQLAYTATQHIIILNQHIYSCSVNHQLWTTLVFKYIFSVPLLFLIIFYFSIELSVTCQYASHILNNTYSSLLV